VIELFRQNLPFIAIGVAGGAAWAVIMFNFRKAKP
jgi:hypothetical protein